MPLVPVPDYGSLAPLPYGFELGIPYELVGPTGHRVVFNDRTDPDFVGRIDEITGLDGAETRESAEDVVEGDGGVHGDFFHGRRPITISGQIDTEAFGKDRNLMLTKLFAATNAMRADAVLTWTPTGGVPLSVKVRRQGAPRTPGGRVKTFALALVAADNRIYAKQQQEGSTTASAVRRNLVTNPNFETNASGWVQYGAGGVTLSRVSAEKLDGQYSLQAVSTGAGVARGVSTDAMPSTPGRTYTGSLYFKAPAGRAMTFHVAEYQADGTTFVASSTAAVVATGGWQRVSATHTTTTGTRLRLVLSVNVAIATTFWVDEAMTEEAAALGTYFPTVAQLATGEAGWVGTAHGSVSYLNAVLSGGGGTFTGGLSSPLATNPGESGLVRVYNLGNTDSPPILRLRGPMKNPIITHKTTGRELRLTVQLLAGQVLDLDARDHTIIMDGDTNRYSTLDFGLSNWWNLEPGVNDIKLSAADFTSDAGLTVYWQHAFN